MGLRGGIVASSADRSGGGIETGGLEDLPGGGGGYVVAEFEEFAVDGSVASGGVIPAIRNTKFRIGCEVGWRVSGRHQPRPAQGPVGPAQARPRVGSAEYDDLVAQNEQFDVLGR